MQWSFGEGRPKPTPREKELEEALLKKQDELREKHLAEGLHEWNAEVERARLEELEAELRAAKEHAERDHLTGVPNRVAFEKAFVPALKIARYEVANPRGTAEGADQVSLLIADIDFFKTFNDTYGHAIGDKVLQRVAATLADGVRDADTVARWGGEEFVILLRGSNSENARRVAEKLRAAVEEIDLSDVVPIDTPKVTASFGVVSSEADTDSTDGLFNLADEALYRAKDAGRNQVVVHENES